MALDKLVKKLSEERNGTPYAHGIMGIKDKASMEYNQARKELRDLLDLAARLSVFDQINQLISDGIK